nr:hybrid signal transduction histidine kinase M [Tanacetum cinerariifolium]
MGHEHKFITEIVVRRANEKIDPIIELDYKHLNKNDIKYLYLLCVNGKVKYYKETGLLGSVSVFIISTIIWERVHNFQLGMDSYQQKVNLTTPTITFPGIERKKLFTITFKPVIGRIYENSKKEKRVMILKEIPKSPISNDDVVNFTPKGFPNKYENVCGIIIHREPFSDLKMARLMLTTEEMRLNSKSQALPVDSSSSSPMILLAKSGNNLCSSTPQVKSSRPCFNFPKRSCRFGNTCKFVHNDSMHAKSSNPSLWSTEGTDTAYLLLYVDDIVLTASSEVLLQHIIGLLRRLILGALQYLTFIRQDISYAVQQLPIPMQIGLVALLLDDRLWVIVCFLATIYYLSLLSVNRHTLGQVLRQSIMVLQTLLLRPVATKSVTQVRVLHVLSRYQYADIFTKCLPSALFEQFRTSLSVQFPPA